LLATSRLAFVLNAWVTLILIMELTIVLFLVKEKYAIEDISTYCSGFA
jgi:hypothetical protein